MLTERLHTSKYSIFDRLLAIDFFLIVIVIAIGAISVFAIHSTESGEFSYYTKNHLIRLISFFVMFLFFSFKYLLTPLIVPPVPEEQTKPSTFPSV